MIECQKEITHNYYIIAHTNLLRRGVLSFIFLTLLCLKVSTNGDYTTLHCDVSLWRFFQTNLCHAIVTSPKGKRCKLFKSTKRWVSSKTCVTSTPTSITLSRHMQLFSQFCDIWVMDQNLKCDWSHSVIFRTLNFYWYAVFVTICD